jgi:hypothetical protein
VLSLLAAVLLAAAPKPQGVSATQPASDRVKPSKSFPVEYVAPSQKEHAWIYKAAQEQQVLETLSRILGVLRMPRPVKLRISSCDGVSNAWYDDTDHTVTFCYEFIADLARNAPEAATSGIALDQAVLGPFTYFYLHEIGHALIDTLKLPVLGREEDAADRFAAFVLLQAGPDVASRTLRATAWTFRHDARDRKLDDTDFADVHGLDAQRFYDLVCLAYGKDPVTFREAPEKAGLPLDRAEECAAEWRQVRYGYQTVLAKYLDRKRYVKVRDEQVARMKAKRAKARADAAQGDASSRPTPSP